MTANVLIKNDQTTIDSSKPDKLQAKSSHVFHVKQKEHAVSPYILFLLGAGAIFTALRVAKQQRSTAQ
jgi:hypothetical protein